MVKTWQILIYIGTHLHRQDSIMVKTWQILIYIRTHLHGQESTMVKTWQILIYIGTHLHSQDSIMVKTWQILIYIGSCFLEEVLEVGKEIMKPYINLVEEFYFITKAISSICL